MEVDMMKILKDIELNIQCEHMILQKQNETKIFGSMMETKSWKPWLRIFLVYRTHRKFLIWSVSRVYLKCQIGKIKIYALKVYKTNEAMGFQIHKEKY